MSTKVSRSVGVVDFRRVERSLFQEARRMWPEKKTDELILVVKPVIDSVEGLLRFSGSFSVNRRMARKIGFSLLRGSGELVCPICINFSKLDFDATCEFIMKHRDYLRKVCRYVPGLKVRFVVSTHEAENPDLLRLTGCTAAELRRYFVRVGLWTQSLVEEERWSCVMMNALFREITPALETARAEALLSDPKSKRILAAHTLERFHMYRAANVAFTSDEAERRTAQTAAQYMLLGEQAAKQSFLICNHTTTSLRWYRQTGVAVLHNPIKLS